MESEAAIFDGREWWSFGFQDSGLCVPSSHEWSRNESRVTSAECFCSASTCVLQADASYLLLH